MTSTCSISDLRPGDAIAFGPVSWRWSPLGWVIGSGVSLATWPLRFDHRVCHFGIVAPYKDKLCVYESTIDRRMNEIIGPCVGSGQVIRGVQAHDCFNRLALHMEVRGGQAWRLPLKSAFRDGVWYEHAMEKFETRSRVGLGIPYDLYGAFCARSFGLGWARHLRPTRADANQKFYCNEYVLSVYHAMGWLPDDVIPSKENPKSTAALLVKRGICGPMQEIRLCV